MDPITVNPDGSVTINDFNAIPDSVWDAINSDMASRGYDWPQGFAKGVYQRITGRGAPITGDHAAALQRAIGGRFKPPKAKRTPALSPRSYNKVLNTFGLTNDMNEAGYILPDGNLLNLRGGAQPGVRGRDHREVGDGTTKSMYQFMMKGPVRIDRNSAHLARPPTPAQERQIAQLVKNVRDDGGTFYLTIDDDIQWEPGREFHKSRKLDKDYPIGTNAATVLTDIRNFFAQKMAKKWVLQNCKFASTS